MARNYENLPVRSVGAIPGYLDECRRAQEEKQRNDTLHRFVRDIQPVVRRNDPPGSSLLADLPEVTERFPGTRITVRSANGSEFD